MSEQIKPKGRPKGAVNNPKFTLVCLADLNTYLKANAMIPVKIEFANAILNTEHEGMDETAAVDNTPVAPIAVTRHVPGK